MLEFQYQWKFMYDGSKIELSEYEDLFRKFMNTLLDLRLVAPVVTVEETIVISLRKYIVEENRFETIQIKFDKEVNNYLILFCDKNRPWQSFQFNITTIEELIILCSPEAIKSLIELLTPQIDVLKLKLIELINEWRELGRPDNEQNIVKKDDTVVNDGDVTEEEIIPEVTT